MTTTEEDLKSVVSAQLGLREVAVLSPGARPGAMGFDVPKLCRDLGMANVQGQTGTITDLGATVRASEAGARLSGLALHARVRRIVGAMIASTKTVPTAANTDAWWHELVTQIIWWHCAEEAEGGKSLVQADIPAEAAAVLIKTGVTDRRALVSDPAGNRATMLDILGRFGMDRMTSQAVFDELAALAKRLDKDGDDQLQRLLHQHANRMADQLAEELGAEVPDTGVLQRALRGWISTMTRLPVGVWSPSTMDFINKFAHLGLSQQAVQDMANDAGIDYVGVDEALSQFSEALCLGCDPANQAHRLCIRKFATIGWEAECVDPANRPPVLAGADHG